ncbi:peptidoglycan hydrolase-like protein with peptidoglycan-binding domain [Nonomuraea thailandensis]|uniref:N-acetylmuramoyl-L-alanine amidase n=1 Tax=Nonomuraea thailandensis TaxID=1188745 RepID=A0A9X2K826_9ACTN|nr:N-acetylmuramoyl-L-alanine amidase [Nonomuraea thailandensis]MCP2363084.1 peptidoglycan hydrolase-like protein with peptidoglycan-binding domain [Nonomuraea thailandensis]
MPYLTQLADVARRTGHPVTEVTGWKSRGHGPQPSVEGIVCHHTAGPRAGGDYPSLSVVRTGRPGLAGPLSQFGLGRSGRIYVIAAGRCWHNAPSTSPLHDNSSSIGIEAENCGSQPWPEAQLDAYRRLCAELCREFELGASRVKAHREVNTSKPDPAGIDMTDFRAAVAALLAGKTPARASWTEEIVKDLPLLRPGVKGWDVKTLRGCLFARGDLAPIRYGGQLGLKAWLESTEYDSQLASDVRQFQRAEGLDDDAVVGRDTWSALLRIR